MNEEKITNSKVYVFFDWLWRLLVLNVLTLITSLGIITFFPAIVACFKSIKDNKENYNTKIIVPYFKNFASVFKETVGIGIVILIMFGISLYAYLWYDGVVGQTAQNEYEGDSVWFTISLISVFAMMGFGLVISMAVLQLPMVTTYFRTRFLDKIRFSFFMAFKFIAPTLLELVILVVDLVVLFVPVVMPLWVFFGISFPLYLIYVVSKRPYYYLSNNQDEEIEDDTHLLDQTEVRENYEDDKKTKRGGKK